MTGHEEGLGYRAHFYGPYSDDVAAAVGWLKTIGAVDQSSSGGKNTDHSGFEIRRYDFRLNDQGRTFAEATARRYPEVMSQLRQAVNRMNSAGDLDYIKLSIAAKTYFMLQETDRHPTETDLALLASRFGWEVTPQQIRDVATYLDRLGLVQIIED
jgi:uncharacterized protein YwgA